LQGQFQRRIAAQVIRRAGDKISKNTWPWDSCAIRILLTHGNRTKAVDAAEAQAAPDCPARLEPDLADRFRPRLPTGWAGVALTWEWIRSAAGQQLVTNRSHRTVAFWVRSAPHGTPRIAAAVVNLTGRIASVKVKISACRASLGRQSISKGVHGIVKGRRHQINQDTADFLEDMTVIASTYRRFRQSHSCAWRNGRFTGSIVSPAWRGIAATT
jgi:hypothetical protein